MLCSSNQLLSGLTMTTNTQISICLFWGFCMAASLRITVHYNWKQKLWLCDPEIVATAADLVSSALCPYACNCCCTSIAQTGTPTVEGWTLTQWTSGPHDTDVCWDYYHPVKIIIMLYSHGECGNIARVWRCGASDWCKTQEINCMMLLSIIKYHSRSQHQANIPKIAGMWRHC